MNECRRVIAKRYLSEIKNDSFVLPYVLEGVEPVWHIFAIRCKKRDDLESYLRDKGIMTNKHYPIPMHLQGAYESLGIPEGFLPIAEEISRTELSLPMYYGMKEEEVSAVIDALNNFEG